MRTCAREATVSCVIAQEAIKIMRAYDGRKRTKVPRRRQREQNEAPVYKFAENARRPRRHEEYKLIQK